MVRLVRLVKSREQRTKCRELSTENREPSAENLATLP
jgi:hypothetical protein